MSSPYVHRGVSIGGSHCTDNDCRCHDPVHARFFERHPGGVTLAVKYLRGSAYHTATPVISATREIASMQLALGNISAEVQRLHAANCQLIYDLKAARAACAALLARNTDLEAANKAGRQRERIWSDEERARRFNVG